MRVVLLAAMLTVAQSANPLGGRTPADYVPGMADPNLHYFGGKFTMWATHDFSVNNTGFLMKDWWIWSSPDLVEWTKEAVVSPAQSLKWDSNPNECWATDAAFVGGTYYFYVSAGGGEVGVMSAPSLKGPWTDPLGKPLLSAAFGSSMKPPTTFRDPCVFQDPDTKENYIVAGVFTYYITKLNPDMISLAETPRLVNFSTHTYGPCGDGKTDDKPFLHKNGDTYYLSWGCFYATSKSVYGPYAMQGAVIDTAKIAPDFQCDGQPGQCGKSTALARLRASDRESDLARAEALASYYPRGWVENAPAAGDPIVLYECSNASDGRASWSTTPTTPAPGVPFMVHPASNHSLCITAPGAGGDADRLVLQPCDTPHSVQHFVRNATSQGDDVHGVGGCPCWNVQDGNARPANGRHGRNDMVVQCYSCVDGASFNPNQRFSFPGSSDQIRAWSGYAAGFCVASAPPSQLPPAPAPPGPRPWFLEEDYTDRHGSFLHHANQWYYVSNDRSHSKDLGHEGVFRDTVICYVHFRANNTMEACTINATGVGQYDGTEPIEAENYFELRGDGVKIDLLAEGDDDGDAGFAVALHAGSELFYPNIQLPSAKPAIIARSGIAASATSGSATVLRLKLTLYLAATSTGATITASTSGQVLGSSVVPLTPSWSSYRAVLVPVDIPVGSLDEHGRLDLVLSIGVEAASDLARSNDGELARLKHFALELQ